MMETLGNRLKQLRESKHLKQMQVAELIDVTRSAICTYENDSRQPSLDSLVRLASLYNVTTDFLLGNQNRTMIDATGLKTSEVALITDLVATMVEKNKKLAFLEEEDYGK